ncbi:MAG: hypothetical protein ACMUHU_06540, partial [Thermoplasmatota archaeon]
ALNEPQEMSIAVRGTLVNVAMNGRHALAYRLPVEREKGRIDLITFDAEAVDVDIGDVLLYSISSHPASDISIDRNTGSISWIGSLEGLRPTPNYVLNVEIKASDGVEVIAHAFTIQVIPTPSPTSYIIGPTDGIRITSAGVLLEWGGEDDGEEPLKYDIYLGTSHTDVSVLDRSVQWVEDVEGTSIHTGNVEKGKTYYWTVIPKDIYTSGICTNDVFSFSVNIPPSIQEFSIPKAKVGVEFRLNLIGSDLNNDDLDFELVEGPIGMELFNDMLTWTPTVSQIGTHTTNISLYDGYEYVYKEFNVEVEEKEVVSQPKDEGSPFVIIIIVILIVLLLISGGLGAFLFFRKKSATSDEESEKGPPETESLETTADESPSIGPPTF